MWAYGSSGTMRPVIFLETSRRPCAGTGEYSGSTSLSGRRTTRRSFGLRCEKRRRLYTMQALRFYPANAAACSTPLSPMSA
jgi:hypothetical protein